jgi:hypothetical protein
VEKIGEFAAQHPEIPASLVDLQKKVKVNQSEMLRNI